MTFFPLWMTFFPLWMTFFRAATGGRINRAATGGRPYEKNDSVEMVGHNHMDIDLNARIMRRQLIPRRLHHSARIVQTYFTIRKAPEKAFSSLHAHRNEIGPFRGIVIPLKADRAPMMYLGIESHPLSLHGSSKPTPHYVYVFILMKYHLSDTYHEYTPPFPLSTARIFQEDFTCANHKTGQA
jgi:hypothetical protein